MSFDSNLDREPVDDLTNFSLRSQSTRSPETTSGVLFLCRETLFCFCAVSVKVFQVHNSGVNCVNSKRQSRYRKLTLKVETDEMFQNAGEKGDNHVDSDPPRRRGNAGDMGLMTNDRRLLVGTAKVPEITCCAALATLSTTRSSVYAADFNGVYVVGAAITVFSAPVKLFSIRMASGQETQTVMVFTRSIQIRLKVPGRRCETSFVPFVAFIKSSSHVAICEFVMNLKAVSVDFIAKLVKSTYS